MRLPRENFRSISALARLFLVAAVGISLDLWTKDLAFSRLCEGVVWTPIGGQLHPVPVRPHEYRLIDGYLHLQVTCNRGAVFGLGQGARWLFLFVSVAAIIFLLYLFAASGRQRFYQALLGILLAGVLGNMYDRVRLQYVRDMIYALPKWQIFPWIFNVADILLCTGVALMLLYSLLHRRHPEAAQA